MFRLDRDAGILAQRSILIKNLGLQSKEYLAISQLAVVSVSGLSTANSLGLMSDTISQIIDSKVFNTDSRVDSGETLSLLVQTTVVYFVDLVADQENRLPDQSNYLCRSDSWNNLYVNIYRIIKNVWNTN